MKRNLLKFILVSIVAITISYGINQSKSENYLSDLLMDNVEALAASESNLVKCYDYGCRIDLAWDCIVTKGGTTIFFCYDMKPYYYL